MAVLTLVGAIDLPIIKFSVDWWNTLHQGASVFRVGGSTIYPTILMPLFIMAGAFTLLFVTLVLAAMRNEILRRRVRTLQSHAGERRELTMETTAHIDFIAAAYAAAVIVVGALVAWVTLDYRAQTRKIAELEMAGFTRRSDAGFGSAGAATRRRAAREQAEEEA